MRAVNQSDQEMLIQYIFKLLYYIIVEIYGVLMFVYSGAIVLWSPLRSFQHPQKQFQPFFIRSWYCLIMEPLPTPIRLGARPTPIRLDALSGAHVPTARLALSNCGRRLRRIGNMLRICGANVGATRGEEGRNRNG